MIQDVLSKLDKVEMRRGYWTAQCPGHSDKKPSLKVSEREDGKVTLTCFAGCSIESILSPIGMKPADLYPQKSEQERPDRWAFRVDGKSVFKDIAAKYDYTDENGKVLYQVVRSFDKDFSVRRPCAGGYSPGLGDRRVLYRLPHVLKALEENRVVWIVEGEKDVWALEAVGEVATTNAGGAQAFPEKAFEYFTGARVNIVQDKDDAGLKRTQALVKGLEKAKHVKVLEAKHGKDSYDHLTSGGTVKDFVRRQDLEPEKQNAVVFMSDVEAKSPRFLWYPYIPYGVMTIVDGDSDVGKSFMTCALAAGLSLGKMPFQEPFEPKATVFFGSEDDASTYRSRLEIFGADMGKIAFVPEPFGLDANGMAFIRDVFKMVEDRCGCEIGMGVMDPISDYVSHTMKNGRPVDWNKSIEVRPCLTMLSNLVMEKDIAWVNVRHYTKVGATGQIDTKHAGEGSTAIRAKHRSQLVVVWDGEIPHRRVVKHDKHNYSGRGAAFGYELIGRGQDNQPDFFWVENVDEESAGMHRTVRGRKKPTASPRDWLTQILMDGGQRSQDIMAMAKQAGYSQDDIWKERDIAKISKVGDEWVWTYKDPFEDE